MLKKNNGCESRDPIKGLTIHQLQMSGILFMRVRFLFLLLILVFLPTFPLAQVQGKEVTESIYVVVKDISGGKLEGYLHFSPKELIVSTKDKQEKSVLLKDIEFIKLEKITEGVRGGGESYYSVKLQNSQELYTLRDKYTFSLKTSLGVVTQMIDPETGGDFFEKGSSSVPPSQNDKPFILGPSVVFSLEFKF